MLFLILFGATVVTLCWLGVSSWPGLAREAADARRQNAPEPATGPAARPQSLEGVLVAQLLTGEITSPQYQLAIEGIAAREDQRHPLAVPPEIGPADA